MKTLVTLLLIAVLFSCAVPEYNEVYCSANIVVNNNCTNENIKLRAGISNNEYIKGQTLVSGNNVIFVEWEYGEDAYSYIDFENITIEVQGYKEIFTLYNNDIVYITINDIDL